MLFILKAIFSRMWIAVLQVFKFIFSDWRITLGVVAAILSVIIYFKIQLLENRLEESRAQVVKLEDDLKLERENNATLRNNVEELVKINASNTKVLDIHTQERRAAIEAAEKLKKELEKSKVDLSKAKTKIDGINEPTTKLTPFLKEALRGVQEGRP